MIAYNRTGLDNRVVGEQAAEALAKGCITLEEYTQIGTGYPVSFYTPNGYIRIGLFLLTVVIAAFSLGLLGLMSISGSHGFGGLLIFFGLVSYGVLEYMVAGKKHFRSGVDDALLWMSVGLLYAGLELSIEHMTVTAEFVVAFSLAFYGVLRFADGVLTLVAYGALLGIIFNMGMGSEETGGIVMFFILMGCSVGVYWLCIALYLKRGCRHYRPCLMILRAACLVGFYAAGNYFVVREMGSYRWDPAAQPGGSVPLGWLFWILTVGTPLFYVYRGVRKKDVVFLWVGLALIAAAVFTIRQYYHVLPAELAMVVGGILLIGGVYVAINYLRTPRHGLTYAEINDKHFIQNLHIESLVIAETFAAPAAPAADGHSFGGGSGGGGGAGGEF